MTVVRERSDCRPDGQLVARRVAELGRVLLSHAGGLELVELSSDGRVCLRYTGFCTGCPYRPLTTAGTVRPALMQLPGVTGVEIVGSRISEEAEARLARYLKPYGGGLQLATGGGILDSGAESAGHGAMSDCDSEP